jgi:hypothetical protein
MSVKVPTKQWDAIVQRIRRLEQRIDRLLELEKKDPAK